MSLMRLESWMPTPPPAVVEADAAIDAAIERLDKVEDETFEMMQAIVAKRREIAQPWDGKERDAFYHQRTYGARRRVTQAETNLGRVAAQHAAEWAPAIERDIESLADETLAQLDEVLVSLNRLARLRALLDDVQDAPPGMRYFMPRWPGGRLRDQIAGADHGKLYDWLVALVREATPAGRAARAAELNPAPRTRVAPAVPQAEELVPVEQITGTGGW